MKSNKISVIMPVYNGEKYLAESIESVLCQTYKDFELIIIDDSSTDSSKKIALDCAKKDDRIKVIDNKHEKGVFGALNTGLDESSGEYIARADADDINRPERLFLQVKFLNDYPQIDVVGGGYKLFGMNSEKEVFHPENSMLISWRYISDTYFCHPTVMFRRSVLKTISHYPKSACEDFAFFSKILKFHRGYNLQKILIDYRQHNNNSSNTNLGSIKSDTLETYKQNYLYYTGTPEHSDVFYNFHAKQDLKIKDVPKIFKVSLKIISKISKQYGKKNHLYNYLYLGSVVKIEIIISILRHYYIKLIKNK